MFNALINYARGKYSAPVEVVLNEELRETSTIVSIHTDIGDEEELRENNFGANIPIYTNISERNDSSVMIESNVGKTGADDMSDSHTISR
jgi:hypothetical protein